MVHLSDVRFQISDYPVNTMHEPLVHLLIHSPDPDIRRATLVALTKSLASNVVACDTRVDMVAHLANLVRTIQEAP